MITSLSNDRVKDVRALQSRKRHRDKTGRFVVEGTRLVEEAALADIPIESVFYTEDYAEDDDGAALLDELSQIGAVLIPVDGLVMEAMSDTHTPQGVLAVLPTPALDVPADLPYALVIDGVGDPGNLGTIMRAAASGAVPLLITAPGTVDPTNPKVVRGAMGAHFRLPIRQLSWDGVAAALGKRAIFLADVGTGANYYDVDWTQHCALIVSEEAHGPSPEAARLAHARVTIPMPGHMESLNVAMAASILIFERVRQQATHERS
jgi:TrmH family RNA methyltransferase